VTDAWHGDEVDSVTIGSRTFWTGLWGYQKREVDAFLADVAVAHGDLEHALAASEALVARLRREATDEVWRSE
jgi:DivIVA domain-containing protein